MCRHHICMQSARMNEMAHRQGKWPTDLLLIASQDFYTQADAAKAAKSFSGSAEAPSTLAGAVKSGKRSVVLVGGALLGLLILYVMWPSGSSYGYDGVEETEHFVSVSGTQVGSH